jgi:hypothetical protein
MRSYLAVCVSVSIRLFVCVPLSVCPTPYFLFGCLLYHFAVVCGCPSICASPHWLLRLIISLCCGCPFACVSLPQKLLAGIWDHLALCVSVCPPIFFLCGLFISKESRRSVLPKMSFIQYLYCCLHIRCRGNLSIESFLSSERVLWLRYTGFQASYYNIVMEFSCGTPGFHGTRFGKQCTLPTLAVMSPSWNIRTRP